MNARILIPVLAASTALPALAAPETYVIDPVHSQPQWEATHVGFSSQHGNFAKSTGKVTLDRAAKTGTIDVTIDTASIRTYDDRLDAIVKGERFFNVEKFPTMTFKSSNVTFDGDKVVGAEGELTMVGVTRPVTLKVVNFVCGEEPFRKRPVCGAEATTTIKRSDFGMTSGLNIGNPGDEIKITLPVEGHLQPQS